MTDYYADFTLGSDGAAGTIGAPFKTINKLNQSLVAGDTGYLKRGERFRPEQIKPVNSGSLGNPITYGAYSSGVLPIVDCSEVISSWTSEGGSAAPSIVGTVTPSNHTGATNYTKSFTVTGNKLIIGFVNDNTGTISNVRWGGSGGATLTQAVKHTQSATIAEIWELVSPTLGTADIYWEINLNTIAHYCVAIDVSGAETALVGTADKKAGGSASAAIHSLSQDVVANSLTISLFAGATSGTDIAVGPNSEGSELFTDVGNGALRVAGQSYASGSIQTIQMEFDPLTAEQVAQVLVMLRSSGSGSTIYYASSSTKPLAVLSSGANRIEETGAKAALGAGEWWWDDPNDRVYIGDDPAGATVEFVRFDNAVDLGVRSYVEVADVRCERWRTYGFLMAGWGGATIHNVARRVEVIASVAFSASTCIYVTRLTTDAGATLDDCLIEDCELRPLRSVGTTGWGIRAVGATTANPTLGKLTNLKIHGGLIYAGQEDDIVLEGVDGFEVWEVTHLPVITDGPDENSLDVKNCTNGTVLRNHWVKCGEYNAVFHQALGAFGNQNIAIEDNLGIDAGQQGSITHAVAVLDGTNINLRRNRLSGGIGGGVQMANCTDCLCAHDEIYNMNSGNRTEGAFTISSCVNCKIYRPTISNMQGSNGKALWVIGTGSGNEITGVAMDQIAGSYVLATVGAGLVVLDYNRYPADAASKWSIDGTARSTLATHISGTTYDDNSIQGAPGWVDPATGNFTITEESPLANAGVALPSGGMANPVYAPYSSLVFFDDFEDLSSIDMAGTLSPGFKWYRKQVASAYSTPVESITLAAPSILRLGARPGVEYYNNRGRLQTAAALTGTTTVGNAWGNGFYLEIRMKWTIPQIVNIPSGQFWGVYLWDIGYMMHQQAIIDAQVPTQGLWPGHPTPLFAHFTELDLFEFRGIGIDGITYNGKQEYQGTAHDWAGTQAGGFEHNIYNSNFVQQIPFVPDWTAFHTYGLLWIPQANAETPGRIEWCFDDQKLGSVFWKNPGQGHPIWRSDWPTGEVDRSTSGLADDIFAVIDQLQLGIQLDGHTEVGQDVDWVKVWQPPSRRAAWATNGVGVSGSRPDIGSRETVVLGVAMAMGF